MRLVALGLSIILLSGVLGYAQGMGPMHKKEEVEMTGPPIEDLTLEQRTKIDEIKTETRKVIIPIRAQIELKEIDLNKEMKNDKLNKDKILKIAQEIHELEWQIKKAHLEEQVKITSILTPEQREKMRMMPMRKMIKKIEIERENKD